MKDVDISPTNSKLKTKEELLLLLINKTEDFCITKKLDCTAYFISEELFISRNLASQYLNELVKENILIKIVSRPVFFLHKSTVEKRLNIVLQTSQFADVDDFFFSLQKASSQKSNFSNIIGNNASLSHCIKQLKSAVNYPPNGLPVLLIGEKGTGKKLLGSSMFDYGISQKIFKSSDTFKVFNCSYLDKKDNNDLKHIFGVLNSSMDGYSEDSKGLIEKVGSGILFINHAENLSEKCQQMLSTYLLSGSYNKSEDYEKTFFSDTRIVLSTTPDKEKYLIPELLEIIPIVCNIPSLEDRSLSEKKEIILYFLKEESKRLSKDIRISENAFNTLLNYQYPSNVKQLNNEIKLACANGNYDAINDPVINLYQYHLSNNILSSLKNEIVHSDVSQSMYSLIELENDESSIKIKNTFNNVIGFYTDYLSQNITIDQFFNQCLDTMNKYFDYIVFDKKYVNERIKSIEHSLIPIIDSIVYKYKLYTSTNFSFILARILYSLTINDVTVINWNIYNLQLEKIYKLLDEYYKIELIIAREMALNIKKSFDIYLDKMHLFFIVLYIRFLNDNIEYNDTSGIILAHGYSTASSIADASNRLIGKHIFEAIDMSVDTPINEIKLILKNYLSNKFIGHNVILLVDMGSLENICFKSSEIPNINIGIINNISTKIALEIGFKILEKVDMEEILQSTCNNTVTTYKIIAKQKKEKAIVFTSEAGIPSTKRVMELFKNSLPRKIDVKILCYDFELLSKNLVNDNLFTQYDVICIIGSFDLKLENISFIALEDIITFQNMYSMNNIFSDYLNPDEMTIFNNNLLKNFSIENIMNYLTILNPTKLFDYVELGMDRFQRSLKTTFDNKTKVGLYIHISCLIERLVTKAPLEACDDMDNFLNNNKDFINKFKDCFSVLSHHYNIDIPISEISYVYRYIKETTNYNI